VVEVAFLKAQEKVTKEGVGKYDTGPGGTADNNMSKLFN